MNRHPADTIALSRNTLIKITSLFCLPAALLGALLLAASAQAATISFGSGLNQFNMDFVPIGSPGNAADTNGVLPNPSPIGAGAVGYTYQMGTYEVSRDMITKANNSGGLGITLNDMTSFGGNGVNRPATGVSWNEAARFVNWLNTSTGGFAAYKTSGGVNSDITTWDSLLDLLDFDINNPFRSLRTNYVLPSANEWYKAAYYDPAKSGPDKYWNYATGSDSPPPTAVAGGTLAGTAVYGGQAGPADINNAGGLSPFGVMGLGGNVREWEETEFDLVNNSPSSDRGVRGGGWGNSSLVLSSSHRGSVFPTDGFFDIGFRVASLSAVPEPSTYALVMTGLTVLGWSQWRRRGK